MTSEFELIQRYFTRPAKQPATTLGVGDDCALLQVSAGQELAISTDMLVAGTHFFPHARPDWLGHKALAVNLSDLAAMGATPRWALLALSLPSADGGWLKAFSEGLYALADEFNVELVGGDTTHGPLTICLTVGGELPPGAALRRDAAKSGDDIWVTGTLGDAALALAHLRGEVDIVGDVDALEERLHRPQPRVAAGVALRGIAHAAIDVSDGLAADLGHILERSQCGATVRLEDVPRSPAFSRHSIPARAAHWLLAGGDDYELCFTAPPSARAAVEKLARELALPMTRIGTIDDTAGLRVLDAAGKAVGLAQTGYDHFT